MSEYLSQVDWKKRLDGTEQGKAIIEFSNEIARRGAALKAFHWKYYNFFLDERKVNVSGNYRGTVVSGSWRKFFGGLGQFGAALEIAGIPMEAASLSWDDLSAKGISANAMVTMARWSTKSVLLGPSRIIQTGSELAGRAAGGLGFREAAKDIEIFSVGLEANINYTQEIIDQALSVANARDVVTPIVDAIQGCFDGLVKEAHSLHDAIVDAIASHM